MEITAAGREQSQSTGNFFHSFCLSWCVSGVAAFDAVQTKGNQFFAKGFHLGHIQIVKSGMCQNSSAASVFDGFNAAFWCEELPFHIAGAARREIFGKGFFPVFDEFLFQQYIGKMSTGDDLDVYKRQVLLSYIRGLFVIVRFYWFSSVSCFFVFIL